MSLGNRHYIYFEKGGWDRLRRVAKSLGTSAAGSVRAMARAFLNDLAVRELVKRNHKKEEEK